jgi:glyoxylase-like metal-dependent hydrolase (beta-lactamase superfamily II)
MNAFCDVSKPKHRASSRYLSYGRAVSELIGAYSGVTIRRIAVSTMSNNVYLLTGQNGQILIDAADDAPAISELLRQGGQPTTAIITTHSHWDHARALAAIAKQTGARLLAGRADLLEIAEREQVGPIEPLDHLDHLVLSGLELDVISLRGHTPGSIALAIKTDDSTQLFTGDSLFADGVGNTWGDQQRFRSLISDVTERLFAVYPDDTLVHPGHGPSTSIGQERPNLAEWHMRGW